LILAAGAIGSFMTLPGQTNGVALFFDPIALTAPLIGRRIDRRGPRLTAAAIAIAMGLACVVMALTWSALTLIIGFAALRGATIGGLSLVS
jgi:hypothetical protein